MRLQEIDSKPKLIGLYYFSVNDFDAAAEIGLKQDKRGSWYLPRYNTSGSGFDRKASSAMRLFGDPINVIKIS